MGDRGREMDYKLPDGVGCDDTRACVFYEAWRGECNDDAVFGTDPPVCSEHNDTSCRVCGDQATTQCGSAGSLVCGIPLCEVHECPKHDRTGHGAPRDFVTKTETMDKQNDDIVEELLDHTDEERSATGTVDGNDVALEKGTYTNRRQQEKWAVEVSTGSETKKKTFDDATDADEYFEVLLRRYNLTE